MNPTELPLLREELDLLDGPAMSDGQPSWTLHDPVRNLFFRIDWLTFEVLKRWPLGKVPVIVTSINQETTLSVTDEDVMAVIRFFEMQQLLLSGASQTAKNGGPVRENQR
jgi:putative peptide zinc metalloprotease protein